MLKRYEGTPSQSKEEAEIRALDEQTEADLQVREQRPLWAKRVFGTSLGWLTAVLLLVAAQGLGLLHLADSVLIALITTTTANILGTFVIVLKFIFPERK